MYQIKLLKDDVKERRVEPHYLHDVERVPKDGVSVEVRGGIKPEIELHFTVTFTSCEHIGMENIRLSCNITQELEVYLIPCLAFRGKLWKHYP